MSSVLFDNPGPRAVARNRVIGVAVVLLLLAIVAFVLWRFAESGQFSAAKWRAFGYPRIWQSIFGALGQTLAAFATAGVASLVLGLLLAVGRLSDRRWIGIPVTLFIELFRAIPVLILMMLMYYGLPFVGLKLTPYLAVVIALTLYNGSVFSEIFRAGIEALPRGQKEAGYAIGLRKSGVMRLILFPQAIRSMLPVIIAQLVVALKDTALGSIITYNELLYYAKYLGNQSSLDSPIIPAALVIGAIYIGICLLLSGLAKWIEIRTKGGSGRGGRTIGGHPAARATTDTQLIAAQD
ncbi:MULTISPECIES: amino acid ABC transporter permease [unclassified Rathayibacter]|uniref:amino acid ABC transporter permease n=1 Tax=unclassified Rathayibacter TaxID=2609250 RepID=UPI00188C61C0|nr:MULTISPECIES: amino acid ABC transporter permease [unclassified Rathayibacter]MBF4463597.1 amino acid ABC transporter permease [Rathayibacter sp. VKM Ac-2879]MBF4504953.1 amino acid ABC transporter permease [Rathayibacter sp. VKM Ac-2878]